MKRLLILLALLSLPSAVFSQDISQSPCFQNGASTKCFPSQGLFLSNQRSVRYGTDNETNYVELIAPTGMASNFSMVLPSAASGHIGYELYDTDGFGALGWTAPGITSATMYTEFDAQETHRPADIACVSNITLSGSQTCDGQSTTFTFSALVMGQTDPTEDGWYFTNAFGAWTRLTGDSGIASIPGHMFCVTDSGGGTNYSDTCWIGGGDGSSTATFTLLPRAGTSTHTNLTASKALVTNASGQLTTATTSATEIGYVAGVTSAIQTQLGNKTTNPMTTTGDIIYASNTATPATAARLGVGSSTQVVHGGTTPSYSAVSLTADVSSTLPIGNGGTAVTSVTTSPTASSFAGWDTNSNLSANNHIEGYATTATAAGTTTLTVASAQQQYFTGVSTQTVKLPVTSTLVLGQSYTIVNNAAGSVTVQSSGSNTIQAMVAGTYATFTCILTSGTSAASWSVSYGWNFASPLTVVNGGTGDATLTSNGVLYGNGTSAVGITAQGAANSVLVANAGAPSFSQSPTINNNLTLGVNGTTTGGLILNNGNTSGQAVTIQNAGTTSSWSFNLPTGAGTSGQPLLSGGGGVTAQTYGTLSVGAGGTGITSGTSGGVPYYSSTSTIASSALLTNHAVVIGAGAAAAPKTISAGTDGQLLVGVTSGDPAFGNTVSTLTNFTGGYRGNAPFVYHFAPSVNPGSSAVAFADGAVDVSGDNITQAYASSKSTFTFGSAGWYMVILDANIDHVSIASVYSEIASTLSGSATRYVTHNGNVVDFIATSGNSDNEHFTAIIMVNATASQTLAIAPTYLVSSGNGTGQLQVDILPL